MDPIAGQPVRRAAFRLPIACTLEGIRPAILNVRAFLEQEGLGEDEAAACELALVEACNNAIAYVDPSRATLPVVLEALCDADSVELRVEDHTLGFDWPLEVQLPDDDSESGRGLFLIKSLADEVSYLRGARGNCLVMRRQRTQPGPVSAGTAEDRLRTLERRLAEDDKVIRDMAEELSSCYESLSAIFRYSGEQLGTVRMDDFARRLLSDLLRVTSNDWYVFRLLRPGTSELALFAASEPGLALDPLVLTGAAGSEAPVELQTAVLRRESFFDPDHPLRAGEPLAGIRPGSVGLVQPVCLGDVLVGTLAVGGEPGVNRFTAARLSVVQTFADFLALQIVNTRFQDERVRTLLFEREIQIAKHIQRSLLPATLPQPKGFQLAASCESANDVGGDFYDVIALPDSSLLVTVGDVMGKGLPAAMFAMILRSLVRASRDYAMCPGRLLARANELLYEELSRVEMFITAQVAFVDVLRAEVVVASAGHCPLLVSQPGHGGVQSLSPEGMPIGVLPDTAFDEERVPLDPGCRLVMFTDGLTESAGADGEMFGQTRLLDWLRQETLEGRPVSTMRESLLARLAAYQGSRTLSDDQTFVILGR